MVNVAYDSAVDMSPRTQIEEAERWYKLVLEKAPKEEEARFRLGYLRLQREDYRGAAEAFEGCLKYRPQWPEAYANLALAYGGMGDRDRAERLYEKMLDNDPKSMDALRGLAALAIQASDFDTALKQLRADIGLGIVTRSEKGCVVASVDGVTAVPAFHWKVTLAPARVAWFAGLVMAAGTSVEEVAV